MAEWAVYVWTDIFFASLLYVFSVKHALFLLSISPGDQFSLDWSK